MCVFRVYDTYEVRTMHKNILLPTGLYYNDLVPSFNPRNIGCPAGTVPTTLYGGGGA